MRIIIIGGGVLSRMCVECVEAGGPGHEEKKLHIQGEYSDLNCFHSFLCQNPSSRLWTVASSQLRQWLFMEHELQSSFRVSLSHCSSVLTQSEFQCSLRFSHLHLQAILTGKLLHHSCLLLL